MSSIDPVVHDQQDGFLSPARRSWAIFLISVVGLFLEMLLIRWIGTEVRIFAYLQNTILIACFVGLGLGCFTSRKPIAFSQSLVPLAILVVLMAVPASRRAFASTSEMLSVFRDLVIWGQVRVDDFSTSLLFIFFGLALTFALLILIVDIYVPLGRLLARAMDEHPNTIWAYSLNIAGSLIGTWLFVLISWFSLPPLAWFVVLAGLLLVFLLWSRKDRAVNFALLSGIVVCSAFVGVVPDALQVTWSPYQKLELKETFRDKSGTGYIITVNNAGYQMMADLRDSSTTLEPTHYPPEMQGLSQYDIPLLLHPDPKTYLIVGAGAGNDAAGGLRHNVEEITAVEIDPAIIAIGRAYHPEQPYSSPKVNVVNDDARSFFATTAKKFDVISFGLLDSHTTTAMTNARLDHYVYTRESIDRAKSLLADGGIMVLSFEAQKSYIADRMATVLQEEFGQEPIVFRIPSGPYGWGGVLFIEGDLAQARQQIAQNPRLAAFIAEQQKAHPQTITHTSQVTTDDWPYIYLESPTIPTLYYLLAALMGLVLFRSMFRWQARDLIGRWRRSHGHFFFLGAAFLLLEVQNISKASVVLGNTWQVNAVIVSGVLAMALLANAIASRFPRLQTRYAYIGLIAVCVALYFVDLAQFAFLPYPTKALVVGSLTTLPMLFSGIIFVRSFASVIGKDEALGANLVGSLAGALLESITFVIGIKALLLIVAGLYILSFVTMPGEKAAEVEAPQPSPSEG